MKTLASSGEAEVEVSSGRERLAGTARCRVTTAPLYIDGALKAASPLRRYRTALGRVPEAAQSLWNRLGAYTDREAYPCLGDEMSYTRPHGGRTAHAHVWWDYQELPPCMLLPTWAMGRNDPGDPSVTLQYRTTAVANY